MTITKAEIRTSEEFVCVIVSNCCKCEVGIFFQVGTEVRKK